MSSYLSAIWLIPIILLVILDHVIPQDECVFPDYLQHTNGNVWTYNLTQAGSVSHSTRMHKITFNGLMWEGTVGMETTYYTYTRECVIPMGTDTLLLVHIENGKGDKYFCVQFIKRSPVVVSMKISKSSNAPNTNLCSRLKMDDRPLLLQGGSHYEDCPDFGGLNLQIFDKNGDEKCKEDVGYETMRMESNCDNRIGALHKTPIIFDLKGCGRDISDIFLGYPQSIDDKFYCRARWRKGLNSFAIISKKDDFTYWCLKYPKSHKDNFTAILFSDVVCEHSEKIPNDVTSYAHLTLTRQEVTSHCTDASEKCTRGNKKTTCTQIGFDNSAHTYCRNTCDEDCEGGEKGLPCNFGHANGTYSTMAGSALKTISLGDTAILDPMDELYCMEEAKYAVLKKGEHPVIQYRENGCFPQLYCLYVQSLSPTVLGYKLLRGPQWPVYALGDNAPLLSKVCSGTAEANQGFKYYAKDWKAAVAEGPMVPRPCDIPGLTYRLETYLHATGESCVGRLHKPDCTGRQASHIIIDLNSCTNHSLVHAYHFTCIATIPNYDPAGQFRLVKDALTGEYQCLYIPDHLTQESGTVTILTLEQCDNEGRYNYILDLRLTKERSNPCQTTTPPAGQVTTSKQGSKEGSTSNASALCGPVCLPLWHTCTLLFILFVTCEHILLGIK